MSNEPATSNTLDDIVDALRAPEAFDHPVREPIDTLQTHTSIIVFAGDDVFKLKKPLKLAFLDYGTLGRRRHFCEEEVRLNRRLAPSTYLGVASITRDDNGRLAVNGEGDTIEYAVRMKRLPHDGMLGALLDEDRIDDALIDEIVSILAEFHRDCATGADVDEHGRPEVVRSEFESNLDEIDELVANGHAGDEISRDVLAHLRESLLGWHDRHANTFRQRIDDGRVREGHGDLHADNICVTDTGVVIYDCIEFSMAFRCRDVAGELAFLAMDCDLRGGRTLARAILERYADATSDPDLPDLARGFKAHFAAVRAKVALLRAKNDHDDQARHEARLEAMRYIQLAAGYWLPPALFVMCGLPGSGKSFTASAIARPLGADVLRSDVIRKVSAGLEPEDSAREGLDEGLYTSARTDATYREMVERADTLLRDGRTVIIDATCPTPDRRAPFVDVARDGDVPYIIVHVTSEDDVVLARLRERETNEDSISDAGISVYEQACERFVPPDEFDHDHRVTVTSPAKPERLAGPCIDALIRRTRRA